MSTTRLLLFVAFLFGLFHIYLHLTRDPGLQESRVAQEWRDDQGFVQMAVGPEHACGVGGSGGLWCWGQGKVGQLGGGRFASSATPVPVVGLPRPAVSVAIGGTTSCAVLDTGALWCWGTSGEGQLGLSSDTAATPYPIPIQGIGPVASVALGPSHICATQQDGALFCWGERRISKGKDIFLERHTRPNPVAGAPVLGHLVAGTAHTCGVDPGNRVLCWGGADQGVLGQENGRNRRGITEPTLMPVVVDGPIRAMASGSSHACAMATSLVCWGGAQPGDNPPATHPASLDFPQGIRAIAGGQDVTCALGASGETRCAQTGQGRSWPGFPPSAPPMVQIHAQMHQLCGIDAQGGAWCTGLYEDPAFETAGHSRPSHWVPDNSLQARWERMIGIWARQNIRPTPAGA